MSILEMTFEQAISQIHQQLLERKAKELGLLPVEKVILFSPTIEFSASADQFELKLDRSNRSQDYSSIADITAKRVFPDHSFPSEIKLEFIFEGGILGVIRSF